MSAHQNINPDQLKLFMTPQEIVENYAPVEGDRMLHKGGPGQYYQMGKGMGPREDLGTDPRAGEWTDRLRRTDQEPNNPVRWDENGLAVKWKRSVRTRLRGELLQPETNDQMRERKLREAQQPGRSGYEKPMIEHIKEHGVEHPIPLGMEAYEKRTGDPRPMLAGGQHRVAAAHHLNPNMYVPVEYHKNLLAAQREKDYR
jgi:hypothetical protein